MKKLKFWGVVFVFAIILMKPETAVTNAQRAMATWYGSVAPALFPFLALMPLLTGDEACAAYESLFSRWMRPLFGLPGSAAPAVIIGMISGSPGGALTLRRVAVNSNMSYAERKRIALALGGVSPAYLIMGVGQGLYGSASLGLKLAGIQVCIQLLLLVFLPRHEETGGEQIKADIFTDTHSPVYTAVVNLLCICGYMVIFSVIAGVMADLLGKNIGVGLLLIMDLPSGLANLAESQIQGKMILQGAAIGFGGLCILVQNLDVLRSMGIEGKDCLCMRCITAAVFAGVCTVMETAAGDTSVAFLKTTGKTYAISLFVAGIAVLPALYLLSKKIFLNKTKNAEEGT